MSFLLNIPESQEIFGQIVFSSFVWNDDLDIILDLNFLLGEDGLVPRIADLWDEEIFPVVVRTRTTDSQVFVPGLQYTGSSSLIPRALDLKEEATTSLIPGVRQTISSRITSPTIRRTRQGA